jgi:hypothetical protein
MMDQAAFGSKFTRMVIRAEDGVLIGCSTTRVVLMLLFLLILLLETIYFVVRSSLSTALMPSMVHNHTLVALSSLSLVLVPPLLLE